MDKDQTAAVSWTEAGVPVSTRFDDPYFSLADGLAETRHVFLAGNGLPGRFASGFRVGELGFGTGLNLAATCLAWQVAGVAGPLRYTSFEAFPMTPRDMARALAPVPDAAAVLAPVLDALRRGAARVDTPALIFELIRGDARETLPRWRDRVDAWYLDGFAPAKNPELWEPGLMAEVARHTVPGGSFATYSAAGHVRRSLSAAGFTVARLPGFGRKRHMSAGRLAAGA